MAAVSLAAKSGPLRMLVSARSVDEARAAVEGGADFIDLKEPGDGALGGLPLATIREIVDALGPRSHRVPISATIGDLPMDDLVQILSRVEAVGDCGVDYVKVGIERGAAAALVIDALAACRWPVVPVFIADQGIDEAVLGRACAAPCAFAAIMVDTADKHGGSLFDLMTPTSLQRFIDTVRASNRSVGVAGALRATQIDRIAALGPDFAGFRSAVCVGDRTSGLDAERVRSLSIALRAASQRPVPA
ncbi:MAG: (5-formylfuran-3-yl)methyl phosphate synthase [Burkholderiaceae bacterium]|nr:(5-formylfuran-3-yl)methyl phosphate synthase [Burkholderiaceae bacterium]